MRESAASKAKRYLTEGRCIVVAVIPGAVSARVRGEGAVYSTGYDGRWYCSCPARSERCAHILALKAVTAPEPEMQR